MTAKTDHFKKTVWDYYRQHGRKLPWRQSEPDGTFDPYKILVSEMMLQQTQVNRVIPKYQAFLEQFPDIQTLAKAPLANVLMAWNGLGYNRRAKYLHDVAKQLVSKQTSWAMEDLVACKGIGPNTAAAVVAYAYNQPVVFLETNIRTSYIHHFFAIGSYPIADRQILELVSKTLDRDNTREWYWGLMDYGTYIKTNVGNSAHLSKHYRKQSRFEGSSRQIRGQVLRLLIEAPLTAEQLKTEIADNRLRQIIVDLEAENLIKLDDAHYVLAS